MITCSQCREELPEYALGPADAAQDRQMSEHLAACPVCRQELEALQSAWSAMPLMLTPVEPSRELLDRVLHRIDGSQADPRAIRVLSPGARFLSYLTAAAVLIGVTIGFWRITSQPSDDAAARRSVENLAERLGKLQEMELLLASENVRLVSMKQDASRGAGEAFIIWDLAAGQWHFFTRGLTAPPAEHAYQVWIVDKAGSSLPGPMLKRNADGIGSVVVDLPKLDLRDAAKAVVTLEPIPGSKQPTGKVYLEAAL